MTSPDGSREVLNRTIVDRIGFAARQGAVQSISFTPDNLPAFTDLDLVTLHVLGGRFQPGSPTSLRQELAENAARLADSGNVANSGPQIVGTLRDSLTGLLWSQAGAFLTRSDIHAEQNAAAAHVKGYWGRPRIVIVSSRTQIDPDTKATSLSTSIDLRLNSMRAIAFPQQNPMATLAFQTTRGVFDTVIERNVMQTSSPNAQGRPVVNTVTILEAAEQQGIPLVSLTSADMVQIDALNVSLEAKARITLSLQSGCAVLVPQQAVELDGENAIGWFEIDPVTGETIGVSEDGGHQATVAETLAPWLLGALLIWQLRTPVGILAGLLGGIFQGAALAIAYPINCATDPTGCRSQLITDKSNAINSFSSNFGLALGLPSVAAYAGALKAFVQATFGVDPPVLPFLASPHLPNVFPSHIAKSELVVTGTPAAVPLQVSASTSSLTTDQNTSVSFDAFVTAQQSGRMTLQAEAPEGWTVQIDQNHVTVTPAPGLQDGTFPVRLTVRAASDPTVVAAGEIMVSLVPTAPGLAFSIEPDPLFTVPFNGAQLPTAYQAVIRNLGPAAETVTISIPQSPTGFSVLPSVDQVTIPAGETGIVGLYLRPSGMIPSPGTIAPFTVHATSSANGISQTHTEPFVVPEVHGLTLLADPGALSTIPGVGIDVVLEIEAVGNVGESVTFDVSLNNGLCA